MTATAVSAGWFRGCYRAWFRARRLGLWAGLLRLGRGRPRRLRLCESLPLGDRRFVAVVEFDSARFLVGGTPSSLVLLSQLADAGPRTDPAESTPNGDESC
jgi:flagellar biogenesis protein FliO